ncbi:MAG TPA: hypothetical protein VGH28_22340 [Polyangiaceae bacterium]
MGAAVVLHAILVAVLPFVHRKHVEPPPRPPIEIDVEESPSSATGVATHHGDAMGYARSTGRTHVYGHARARVETSVTIGPQNDTAQDTNPGDTETSAILGPQSIGLDGPGSFRMEIAKQIPTQEETDQDRASRTVAESLRSQSTTDLTSGPVAQELERTTRRLDGTPFEGRAVFSVDVDELGLVVNVGVSEASGSRAAWDEVARAVLNALAQKRLHVPPGAKRVAMQIEISSKVALPSGAQHPMNVESPAVEGLAHAAHGQFDRPADGPAIVSGSFDFSDIGAHPQRVVGARVLAQHAF